jgi:CO dehydrogenase/acetyl-CoA synthase beta subunit
VEPEVDENHKGPHILHSKVENAIKEMRDKKATEDDDVPVEALKLLGDDGLNILPELINNIYESGEDFIEAKR